MGVLRVECLVQSQTRPDMEASRILCPESHPAQLQVGLHNENRMAGSMNGKVLKEYLNKVIPDDANIRMKNVLTRAANWFGGSRLRAVPLEPFLGAQYNGRQSEHRFSAVW